MRLSRIQIAKQETENLKKIAARYEKMDSTAAAEILTAMCENGQPADAVKILYIMSERSAGKVIGEIADRKLAAQLLEQMKRIEQEG